MASQALVPRGQDELEISGTLRDAPLPGEDDVPRLARPRRRDLSETRASELDPSTENGVGAKMGLDATVPPGAPETRFTRTRVPGADDLEIGELTGPAPEDWQHRLGDR